MQISRISLLALLVGQRKAEARASKHDIEAGPVPTPTMWGPSLYVHEAIKKVLGEGSRYEMIEANGPWDEKYDGQPCWMEKVKFRALNDSGLLAVDVADVYLTNIGEHEKVLHVDLESEQMARELPKLEEALRKLKRH